MTAPITVIAPSGKELMIWSSEQLTSLWSQSHDVAVLADACRLNALSAIQAAGSGHIGTSLSSLDIMVSAKRFLAGDTFLTDKHTENGIFFSSKGHDAPALYATMHLCGQLVDSDLMTLRRLGGLPGHPETITSGVPTNTGSLGMGISKAKGFIKAQRLKDSTSRIPVIVMLGDGELNEGQIWESMPGATRDGFSEVIAIVDANGIQSDTWTDATLPMGDIRMRVEAVGWQYLEIDGHDTYAIEEAFSQAREDERPSFIYAKTVKGSGVSWMESFDPKGNYYKFHSGAIADDLYADAANQLLSRVESRESPVAPGALDATRNEFDGLNPRPRPSSMLTLWEELLPSVMDKHNDAVILDGDLSYDTGTHLARNIYPERYVQAGIAEQDMVSMAGTLALSGATPLVHSFSTFLTMRAAEQIFNNATEYSRVLYFGFLAGLVPSAPGFSHQAVTDVGLMGSVPRMTIVEPSCAQELVASVEWALSQSDPVYFRMGNTEPLSPAHQSVAPGGLVTRRPGARVAFVSSGQLLSLQAKLAADALEAEGAGSPAVYTMPWTTHSLSHEAVAELAQFEVVIVLENHNPARAKALILRDSLQSHPSVRVIRVGVDGIPSNGQPDEVMAHHGVDAASLVTLVTGLDAQRSEGGK